MERDFLFVVVEHTVADNNPRVRFEKKKHKVGL